MSAEAGLLTKTQIQLCVARLRSALLGGTTLSHYLILFRLTAKIRDLLSVAKVPQT